MPGALEELLKAWGDRGGNQLITFEKKPTASLYSKWFNDCSEFTLG